jgi:F-type H+-transporting ATPase subunit a
MGIYSFTIFATSWLRPILSVAEEGGEHTGAPELPSILGMLTGEQGAAFHWINVIYAFAVAIFLCIVAITVYRKRQLIPGPFQNVVEMAVEGMYEFLYGILGEDAKHYLPFIGTLFFYVLCMNLIGIIPGGHSPSTSINITASLALLVFIYVQYTGIKRMGIKAYFDHLAGSPRDVLGWVLVVLLFPIHIIGELAKPFSLAVRLFGNITGEDVLVAAFVGLGITIMSFFHVPIGLPLNVPFILLGLLLSTIQALVFALLSTIYILMMLPHEEHGEHGDERSRAESLAVASMVDPFGAAAVSYAAEQIAEAKERHEAKDGPSISSDENKKNHK